MANIKEYVLPSGEVECRLTLAYKKGAYPEQESILAEHAKHGETTPYVMQAILNHEQYAGKLDELINRLWQDGVHMSAGPRYDCADTIPDTQCAAIVARFED